MNFFKILFNKEQEVGVLLLLKKYQTCFFFLLRDEKHTPSPSSVFDDFEKDWLDLATEWSLPVLDPQYSPFDPYSFESGENGTTQTIVEKTLQSQTATPTSLPTQTSTMTPEPRPTQKKQTKSEGGDGSRKRRLSETEDSILLTLLR